MLEMAPSQGPGIIHKGARKKLMHIQQQSVPVELQNFLRFLDLP
jgi:hypothetical protein